MSKIAAFGTYAPSRVVDNQYFEKLIDTTDEWITSRTGIKTRRWTEELEFSSDMCVSAIGNMQEKSGISVQDVDFIIVCTTSPDQTMPNTASQVKYKLGITSAGCIDIYAACAGFVYGLQIAHGYVNSGIYKKVLVLGAETLSKITDFEDRTSCILFGDAAGAAIIEPDENEHFLAFNSGADGEFGQDLYLSRSKNQVNGVEIKTNGKIVQNGRSVFKWAVSNIPVKVRELIEKANLTIDDIDYIIPHSANLRIIEAISKELEYPMEKIPQSIVDYGNTSTASIPLAIENAINDGRIKPGNKLVMIGFGGGLTFAGAIVKW